jgi:hypothetical protein
MTDIGQLQLVVATDEELPSKKILQLFYLLRYRTRSDPQLGGGMRAAP